MTSKRKAYEGGGSEEPPSTEVDSCCSKKSRAGASSTDSASNKRALVVLPPAFNVYGYYDDTSDQVLGDTLYPNMMTGWFALSQDAQRDRLRKYVGYIAAFINVGLPETIDLCVPTDRRLRLPSDARDAIMTVGLNECGSRALVLAGIMDTRDYDRGATAFIKWCTHPIYILIWALAYMHAYKEARCDLGAEASSSSCDATRDPLSHIVEFLERDAHWIEVSGACPRSNYLDGTSLLSMDVYGIMLTECCRQIHLTLPNKATPAQESAQTDTKPDECEPLEEGEISQPRGYEQPETEPEPESELEHERGERRHRR